MKITKKLSFLAFMYMAFAFSIWLFIISPMILFACLGSQSNVVFKIVALTPTVEDHDAIIGGSVFNATIVHENKNCFEYLINRADFDRLDGYGVSPLHIAAHMPNGQYFVKELLKHGADVNLIDAHGRSPLDVAIEFKREKNVVILREAGGIVVDPFVGSVRGM